MTQTLASDQDWSLTRQPSKVYRRSAPLGLLAAAYLLLLPALPVGAFVYNFFVYPKKHRRWEGTFMCQRCGLLFEPHSRSQSVAHA